MNCWATSLVDVQPWDQKEPRNSNKDINSLLDTGILHVWSNVLEPHLHCVRRIAGITWRQPSLTRQGGGYHLFKNWCQVASSVTRETRKLRPVPYSPSAARILVTLTFFLRYFSQCSLLRLWELQGLCVKILPKLSSFNQKGIYFNSKAVSSLC